MSYAIEINGLRKSFNDQEVVKGIHLKVKKGELFALLGPNGAGKTTTIDMLSTLLKPDGGTALVAGYDVVKHPKEVRKRISLTGQFAALDEGLSGIQNLILIARLYGFSPKEARSIAEQLIQSFGLSDAKDRMVQNYSGGMRRRLDIAASMVTQPDIIFLDEPTTGLDPQSRMGVWEVVRTLLKQGTTVLLTTQYLEEADQLADRIAVIDKGNIVSEGTPSQLKASIGGKTLAIRLAEQTNEATINRLLADHHQLTGFQGHDPLDFNIPVQEAILASQAIHTLVSNKVPIDYFSLSEPSLDEVFLAITASKQKKEVVQ
ncbi:ATP-binding cassette domain-containing protein [Paenibacillus nasutitermitis]|uniref:Daunorubicin resistance protein DrrA family ABC transporter ATP-binding protein n=1 Tax=Paenibacillus nasutitermitis TaxID=1652958 RepID=A0A916ZCT6_9BACL|nr:ATP-binding cassette domain-containing protein [Paenibacillus nasutitermitis]GGD88540.1 daunorubicin resistance protein DrrA family ABC transporter ATP-binding protein [Paenibacillus nasutitermitis]